MITDILQAAKLGNELSDPAKWKRGQKLTSKVVALLTVSLAIIRGYFPEMVVISDELLLGGGAAIASVLALINDYMTTATTKKLGR